MTRRTSTASTHSVTASAAKTMRMSVAARKPQATGLNATPVRDAVERNPKPAPRALAGRTPAAAVYAAVIATPTLTPKTAAASTSAQAAPTTANSATAPED